MNTGREYLLRPLYMNSLADYGQDLPTERSILTRLAKQVATLLAPLAKVEAQMVGSISLSSMVASRKTVRKTSVLEPAVGLSFFKDQ